MDDNDFAAMFDDASAPAEEAADATPTYVRLSARDTIVLLDVAAMANGGVDRTLSMSDTAELYVEGKDQPVQNAAALDLSSERTKTIELEPFRIHGAPKTWRAHSFTAPITRSDVSRAMKTALVASGSSSADALFVVGSVVGFPGRAQNGDVPPEELLVDAADPVYKFTNESLRDAAVLWVAGVPHFALANTVAMTAGALDDRLAALEKSPPQTKNNYEKAALDDMLQACAKTREAIARVLARAKTGPPSKGELARLAAGEKAAWKSQPFGDMCTRDTLVFTLTQYKVWPTDIKSILLPDLMGLVKKADSPLRQPIYDAENRAKVIATMKLANPKGDKFAKAIFLVPILPEGTFKALAAKIKKEQNEAAAPKSKASVAAVAADALPVKPASPKKAPVAADIAKLTPAATEDAIGAALAQDAQSAEPVPEPVPEDEEPAKAKPKRKASESVASTPKKAKETAPKAEAEPEAPPAKKAKKAPAAKAEAPPAKKAKKAPAAESDEFDQLRAELAAAGDETRIKNGRRVVEIFDGVADKVASGKLPGNKAFGRIATHDMTADETPKEVKTAVSNFVKVAFYLNLQGPVGRALRAVHREPEKPPAVEEDGGDDDSVELFD